jgi:hypothetical protein
MALQWFRWCRFHLSRIAKTWPLLSALLLFSAAALIAACAAYAAQLQDESGVRRESFALGVRLRDASTADSQSKDGRVELPPFESVNLVDVLNRVAGETKLPLDEVSFVLDDNGNQPYLRYRATLTVSSGYLAIRRFLDRIRAEQPQISLDSIACTRDDIATPQPTCDLSLSAFYGKPYRG